MSRSVTEIGGFSDRLKVFREHLGKSQKAMESILGLGKNAWQRYESGAQTPGSQVIAGLVRLGINANWLLEGSGPILLDDEQAEEQDLMYRDAFEGDEEASEIRENKRNFVVQKGNAAIAALETAIAATGYRPPLDVTEILKWVAVKADMDESDLVLVLNTLRRNYDKKEDE